MFARYFVRLALSRILVVEDDIAVLEVVCNFLRSTGHQVYSAASGQEARRLLACESIELALIDCLMRGEQGDSLAEYASTLGIPTILTSGDPRHLKTFSESPIPFLKKPFRLRELGELVSRALEALR